MDIYETRKLNLKLQIGDTKTRGAVSSFAREHNLDPTYLRQLLTDHRTIGEKAARKLEEALSIKAGALDLPIKLDLRESKGDYIVTTLSQEAIEFAKAFELIPDDLKPAALRMLRALQQTDNQQPE